MHTLKKKQNKNNSTHSGTNKVREMAGKQIVETVRLKAMGFRAFFSLANQAKKAVEGKQRAKLALVLKVASWTGQKDRVVHEAVQAHVHQCALYGMNGNLAGTLAANAYYAKRADLQGIEIGNGQGSHCC